MMHRVSSLLLFCFVCLLLVHNVIQVDAYGAQAAAAHKAPTYQDNTRNVHVEQTKQAHTTKNAAASTTPTATPASTTTPTSTATPTSMSEASAASSAPQPSSQPTTSSDADAQREAKLRLQSYAKRRMNSFSNAVHQMQVMHDRMSRLMNSMFYSPLSLSSPMALGSSLFAPHFDALHVDPLLDWIHDYDHHHYYPSIAEQPQSDSSPQSSSMSSAAASASAAPAPAQAQAQADKDVALAPAMSSSFHVDEDDDHYIIKADVPGWKPDDISVKVERNRVIISGEHRDERIESQPAAHLEGQADTTSSRTSSTQSEYAFFRRSWPLPSGTDVSHITASFHNAQLKVLIDKPHLLLTQTKQQQVPINLQQTTQNDQHLKDELRR